MTELATLTNASILPVKGSIDGDLYDYVVNVTVAYSNQIKTDFSDLRFAVNNVEVSYFLINYIEGVKANFYVLIPKLPASPAITNIAMFSGNPVLADISDTEIFSSDFFDHFEGTSLDTDKWELKSGEITVANSIANINGVIQSKRTNFESCSVSMKVKMPSIVMPISAHFLLVDPESENLSYWAADSTKFMGFIAQANNWMVRTSNPTEGIVPQYCTQEVDTGIVANDTWHILRFDFFKKQGTAIADDGGTYVLNNSFQIKYYVDEVYKGEIHNVLWYFYGVPDGTFKLQLGKEQGIADIDWIRVTDIIMSSPVLSEQTNWITNADISITDSEGNSLNTILVESLYPNDNSRDQTINLGSTLHDLKNVTIKPAPLSGEDIPEAMVSASQSSYQYVELSLDKKNYYKVLYVPEIKAFTNQLLYMRCTIPDYSYDGPFMCGIEITAESG
ncbi:DUF2341 domain-containing protein [Methanobacterium spitsbergense]|uniref:DUF2341 domain-containing protein n=1 Tax=Methanobacterium spitsbergense TaxID=2874285 RepID=A0A8T5UXJ0_9EURY|nr:DUF2341 domain-containing protein [Methanobacterium spitsbergense]MBZ2167017.1 DUF2341 domain-containing protein [Methanobacterium spitsbergense]